MKALMSLFLIVITLSACAARPTKTEIIPLSITHVEVGLVGDSVVRAIQHNMELNPVVQLEIMARPDFKVIDSFTISEVILNGEHLSFKDSSGTFIESIEKKDSHVEIVIDYFRLKGSSVLMLCKLPVKDNSFQKLSCSTK